MKPVLHFFCILSLIMVIGGGYSAPAYAEKNFLQKWLPALFPDPDEGPGPEETLIAPFDTRPAVTDSGVKDGGAVSLEKQHRSTEEVIRWVEGAVSEVTTFDENDYQKTLRDRQGYFDQAGQQQYIKFLQSAGVAKVLNSNQYYVRSFVEDIPLLLNEGVVEGRYRWLFQVPITLTYMDRAMVDYKESDPVSQRMSVTLQVGRSASAVDAEGIAIETWSGKLKD